MNKKLIIVIVASVLLAIILYKSIGLYVIQPIGVIPDGVTVVYLRWSPLEPDKYLSVPFIESTDGQLLRTSGEVSLFARVIAMGTFMKLIENRILLKLPYFESFYLISTKGTRFEE
jgi:hypothetical protein